MKQTKARSAIVQFLTKEHVPVAVDQIISYLKKTQVDADTVTIYRNLERFYQEGIVNRLELQEGKFRYEIKHDTDHHHLVCEQCGKIQDISGCGVPALERAIKKKKQFLVKRHSLEFFGLCEDCQK